MGKLDLYRSFVAVAECGSFSAAGRLLGTSKSYLSRSITDLENELGLQLLFRTTRQLRLTDAGQFLFAQCQQAVRQISNAHLKVMELGQDVQGRLRVLASDLFGEAYISPLLMQMMADHPRLSVEVTIAEEVGDLIADEYDLAIRYGDLPDSTIMSTKIWEHLHVLVASPDYIRQRGAPQTLDELHGHECLVSTMEPCATWRFWEHGQERVIYPVGRWRSNNGPVLINACISGLGIGRLPDVYVADHIRAGRLRPLLTHFQSPPLPVVAIFPPGRHVPVKTRVAVDYLRSNIQQFVQSTQGSALPIDARTAA